MRWGRSSAQELIHESKVGFIKRWPRRADRVRATVWQARGPDEMGWRNTMAVLGTSLDPESDQFARDRQAMLDSLRPFSELAQQVLAAGGERAVDRHHSRGRLLARERVDLLLDEDAPFLELSSYAGAHEPDESTGRSADHGYRARVGHRMHDHREPVDGEGRIAEPGRCRQAAAGSRHRSTATGSR